VVLAVMGDELKKVAMEGVVAFSLMSAVMYSGVVAGEIASIGVDAGE
jgi:hypothetical protein